MSIRRGRHIMRKMWFVIFGIVLFLPSAAAFAQTQPYCWINAQTGTPAPLGPPGWLPNGASPSDLTGGRIYMPDANHVVNNLTGTTYVNSPGTGWINAKTG